MDIKPKKLKLLQRKKLKNLLMKLVMVYILQQNESQVISNELSFRTFNNLKNLRKFDELKLNEKQKVYEKYIDASKKFTIKPLNVDEYLNTSNGTKFKAKQNFDDNLCDRQLAYIFNGITNFESWTLPLIDSWGKFPAGIFYGNTFDFGNFDQCIHFDETFNNTLIGRLRGHYCLTQLVFDIGQIISDLTPLRTSEDNDEEDIPSNLSLNLGFGIGTCSPASCSPDYIQSIYRQFLIQYNVIVPPEQYPQELFCFHPDQLEVKWDGQDIAMTVILAAAICLLITSSIYDYYTTKYEKPRQKILLAFSLIANGRRLFSCKKNNSPDMLNCINGIRVLSIRWVVLGHTFNVMTQTSFLNMIYLYEWLTYFLTCLITWATVAVDTFLLLSGVLVTWSVLKEMDENKYLNIPAMYLHRYLRLTPSLALIILFITSLYRYIGSGPFYTIQNTGMSEICQENWWATLLYIHNYSHVSRMCLGVTWYLAVDMQLFWLSPLLLIPLWKWGHRIVGVIVVLISLAVGCTFATYYTNNLSLNVFRIGEDPNQTLSYKIYFVTHTRMSSWLVGVIVGYILHTTKNRKVILTSTQVWAGWILSVITLVSVVFGPYQINQMDYEETVIEGAIYMGFARVAWCTALGWIIFACVKGYGGVVNSFLSLSIGMPLARLSYTIYLFHGLVQLGRIGVVKNSDYFSDYYGIFNFLGDFNLTTIISIIWVLLIESPLLNLEQILLSGRTSAKVTT